MNSTIVSDKKFNEIEDLNERVKNALAENGFDTMTHVQAHTIPKIMSGRDVLVAAQTGSGKTLAFVIPALDLLNKVQAKPCHGTLVLIIAPTRELIVQTVNVIRDLSANMTFTYKCLIGGTNRKEEAKKLVSGVNLIAATPGRLLDHMKSCNGFKYQNLALLILDEADRILAVGFEKELTMVLKLLPSKRQTALFSATQTAKMTDIVRLALKNPLLIEIKRKHKLVEGLKQYYLICNSSSKLAILYKILKERSKSALKANSSNEQSEETRKTRMKIMVFVSSCQSVEFHEHIFRLFKDFLPIMGLHGKKKQNQRLEIYNKFCLADRGILFCTNVAARGLDFPVVDYIIQYDPPEEISDYIHRVGRTARGLNATGSALLVLYPEEIGFLAELKNYEIDPTLVKFKDDKLDIIQKKLELIINSTPDLKADAIQAFKKYILAYQSHSLKQVFRLENLDLEKIARSFALDSIPKVNLTGIVSLKRRKSGTNESTKRYKTDKS